METVDTESSNLPGKRGLEESCAPSRLQKKRKHSTQRQGQMMEVEVKKKKKKNNNKKCNNSSTSSVASNSQQENNPSEEPYKEIEVEMVENVEGKGDQETASQPTTQETPIDARTDESGYTAALVNKGTSSSPTAVVGLDCEMVGVGYRGIKGSLARVSVVGGDGRVLLDRYVRPKKRVTDYRTKWSGIKPEHLKEGHDFMKVRREVKAVLQNAIVVGHDLKHDFDVLLLNPRQFKIRDTSIYEPFRELMGSHLTPSLKRLTQKVLGVSIQAGEHSSIQDAQAAVQLYNEYSVAWEERLQNGLEMAHDIKPEMSMQRKLLDMQLNKKKLARRMRRVQKKKKKVRTKKTHTGRTRV